MLVRARVIVLNKLDILLKLVGKKFLVEALEEEAAIVLKHTRFKQYYIG
jgi:hypothetical protein